MRATAGFSLVPFWASDRSSAQQDALLRASHLAAWIRETIHPRARLREGRVRAEIFFATAYVLCALIALAAVRTSTNSAVAAARPFWLRIAVICALFAILRFVDAQIAVSRAFWRFNVSAGLTEWNRPGPYLMLLAIAAFGFALTGFYLFGRRVVHASTNIAALAIVLLVLLAIAHSLALYVTGDLLQAEVGPLTVSRIIESFLLLVLASSGAWFVADSKRRSVLSRSH